MFFSSTTIINNINNPLLLYILFIILNVFVNYTIAYTSVLQPLCGKTDALNYKGQKDYGHFQPCTDELIMAKDVKYYATAPPDRPGEANWANCSEVIPPETLVLPSVDMSGTLFDQQTVNRDYARTAWQPYQWSDYYAKNKDQGPKCIKAMKLYWCLAAFGLADNSEERNYNKYGIIPCRSLCEHVFSACNAYNKTTKYGGDCFSGCFTPTSNPQRAWFDNPNGLARGCFTENLTITLPNCTRELGYECLNGGEWHPECLGCVCPPGFGGFNCGRCSTTGRSFPNSYVKKLKNTESPTALANGACKAMGFNSQCSEYKEFGSFVLPDKQKNVSTYECGVSLENKYPLSVMAGGYVAININIRQKDITPKTGNLYFYISTLQYAWQVGYDSNRQVSCNATNCTQASAKECQAHGVPVDGDDTTGDSCFHCLYAGCQCVPNAIANKPPPPPSHQVRCAFFNKPINYNNPPTNAYGGCNSKTGICYINAPKILPVNPLILDSCETSSCKELIPSTIEGIGPIWISFYVSFVLVAIFTTFAALGSKVQKLKYKNHHKKIKKYADNNDIINTRLLDNENQLNIDNNRINATFLNISYELPKNINNCILNKITGKASMVDNGIYAIMGPSGAGKTTLLDVIAGRKEYGKASGTLLVDGVTYPTMLSRRRAFGYVLQDDSCLPSFLTVKEAIEFSANLRLPPHLSQAERNAKVEKVISQLGLSKVRDSYIGAVGMSGISGGERRRVSIGMELVVEPKVLLLDEPTSGLDATAALKVVNVLTNLVTRGECLVIATIHQPRPDIYSSFGRVLLLSDGIVTYEGPPLEVVDYLNSIGHSCPPNVNIADFALDNVHLLDKDIIREKRAEVIERIFLSADVGREQSRSRNGSIDEMDIINNVSLQRKAIAPDKQNRSRISTCKEIGILSLHYSRELFRSQTLIMLQYVAPLLVGIGFGLIYENIPNDISGVQNRAGAFFAMQVFWCLVSMSALDTWNGHQIAVRRDIASGYYGVFSYFIACTSGEMLLLRFLPPIVFAAPFYYLAHRNQTEVLTYEHFAVFASILVFVSLSFSAICLTIGAAVKNTRAANAVAVLIMVLSLLFGGLLVNRNDAPSYYSYMFEAFPLGYAFEAIMASELLNLNIDFNPKGVPMGINTDGELWLANLGLRNQISYDMQILGIYITACLALSLVALVSRHQSKYITETISKQRTTHNGEYTSLELHGVDRAFETDNTYSNNTSSTVSIQNTSSSSSIQNEIITRTAQTSYQPLTAHTRIVQFSAIEFAVANNEPNILNKITGKASMVDNGIYAIMGPSGAGKTTLLDVIAGRKEYGKASGTLLVDGVTYPTMLSRRRAFGYVLQDDSCLPSFLTVKEAIEFSANLRLPPHLSQAERNAKVEKVISQLGLSKVRDSYIGAVGMSGISGGERRRVSIGMELVVEPKVLLLDEPTSGLDATAALKVVNVLTNLVTRGECLVIATIHQPRPDIYSSFGRVLLLSDGIVTYEGPPLEVVDYLNSIGHSCPPNVNIADFALDVISSLSHVDRIFHQAESLQPAAVADSLNMASRHDMRNQSCYRSLYYLTCLERKRIFRSPMLIFVHLLLSIIMGGVIGIVYYNMRNDLKGTLNRLFSLFTTMTFCALMGTSAVSLFQGNDKIRFLRERASGYYSTFTFLITRVIFDDFFMRFIPSVIFSIIAYNLINYEKVWKEQDFYNVTSQEVLPGSICSSSKLPFQRLGSCLEVFNEAATNSNMSTTELKDSMEFYRSLPIFTFFLMITSSIASNICSTIGALTTTNRVGTFVSVLLILLFTMFSGALINNNLLQSGSWLFGWLRYVSPFEYALEGLLISQMQGQCFLFDPQNNVGSSMSSDNSALVCAEIAGETWLLNLGCSPVGENGHNDYKCEFSGNTISNDLIMLGIFRLLLVGILYLAMYFMKGGR